MRVVIQGYGQSQRVVTQGYGAPPAPPAPTTGDRLMHLYCPICLNWHPFARPCDLKKEPDYSGLWRRR